MIQALFTLLFINAFLLFASIFEKLMERAERAKNKEKLIKTNYGYDLQNTWRGQNEK